MRCSLIHKIRIHHRVSVLSFMYLLKDVSFRSRNKQTSLLQMFSKFNTFRKF